MTTEASDFTLLALQGVPGSRVLLGWNAESGAVVEGTTLHRVSHPFGWHQHYSRNTVTTSGFVCTGYEPPQFLYEEFTTAGIGATAGGSSGAPVVLGNGQSVGQLLGGCGPNPSDGCDYANKEVDGAFRESFAVAAPFLQGPIFSDGFENGDISAWSN